MAPNHKLTSVIKGRTVVGTANADGKMTITFDDDSSMKIKTGDASVSSPSSTRIEPMQPMEPLLPPRDTKRSDVFRNLKWSETKAQSDAARQEVESPIPSLAAPEAANETAATNRVATNQATTGGTVKSVMQGETTMTLQFEDGSKMDVPLQEATSSVMLRDKAGVMEYAD